MYTFALLLHILAATIWTGGHIVLAVVVLPKVLRERSPSRLLDFEANYEKIGMPALIVQVVTGFYLAYQRLPDMSQWLNTANPVVPSILLKLTLLSLTLGFALHARLRVLPQLSAQTLPVMAWHIIPVTLIAILFVVAGVSFRTAWFY